MAWVKTVGASLVWGVHSPVNRHTVSFAEPVASQSRLRERAVVGMRFAIIVVVSIAVAGLAGDITNWPTITSVLGPTAYVFAAHPESETARLRNAIVGHGAGVATGLAALAVFGLWGTPTAPPTVFPSWPRVGAAAAAVAATLIALELARSHHAPAGATALLVATGLAAPGPRLDGLLVGLVLVLVFSPVVGRVLPLRPYSHRDP